LIKTRRKRTDLHLLNYTRHPTAISHGLKTLWLGQSSYLPKTRLGGELEDQYLLLKAYDIALKPTLPIQRWWMSRYCAPKIQAGLEKELRYSARYKESAGDLFMKPRILLTGAATLVGAEIVKDLLLRSDIESILLVVPPDESGLHETLSDWRLILDRCLVDHVRRG